MELSDASLTTAAILLFALVTVETGGLYLVRVVRGTAPATGFQESFARAGHAHAGVLLILSLVALPYADAAGLDGALGWLGRSGVPVAALLMSGGVLPRQPGARDHQPQPADRPGLPGSGQPRCGADGVGRRPAAGDVGSDRPA